MRPKRLRKLLAWFCSEATLTRIVDPVVSDMTIDTQRRAWRGYLDLVRALALHAFTSLPTLTARLINGDGRALPRALAWSVMVAGLATVPFLTMPALGLPTMFWFHPGYTSVSRVRRMPGGRVGLHAVNETAHMIAVRAADPVA